MTCGRQMVLTGRLFTKQSRTRLEGEVVPRPFRHHTDAVPESDKEENVNNTPKCPGQEAGRVDRADLSDSLSAANCGQPATVCIGKRWLPVWTAVLIDQIGNIPSSRMATGAMPGKGLSSRPRQWAASPMTKIQGSLGIVRSGWTLTRPHES